MPSESTDGTTVRVSQNTKSALDEHNRDKESYDETIARLAGAADGEMWTEQEIEDIAVRAVERDLMQQR